jgi:hypothetical protein
MQHANIPSSHNMDQLAGLDISYLDETRLKSQDVRIRKRERSRRAFPGYSPIGPRSPAVAVHEEREIGVVEQEFTVESLNVDWLDVLLLGDKVKGGVGLIEQGLSLGSLQTDNFESLGAADAEGGSKEVD